MDENVYEFDVALSFAGEEIAEWIVDGALGEDDPP
jgi:hypothetical protein